MTFKEFIYEGVGEEHSEEDNVVLTKSNVKDNIDKIRHSYNITFVEAVLNFPNENIIIWYCYSKKLISDGLYLKNEPEEKNKWIKINYYWLLKDFIDVMVKHGFNFIADYGNSDVIYFVNKEYNGRNVKVIKL